MRCISQQTVSLFFLLLLVFTILPVSESFCQEGFQQLIRKVQQTSQQSYDAIKTVSFKGRSKSYAYFGFAPLEVDLIPMYDEYYFDGFWMKPDSIRLVIKALRSYELDADSVITTISDEMPLPNPFHYVYDPSALDIKDDDDGRDVWPLYPFAMGADSVYDYRLMHEVGFGFNKIYTVEVTPKRSDIPAVVGTFQIDADRYEVVGSDVIFNEASSLFKNAMKDEGEFARRLVKGTDDHHIKTEKALLYGSYWLPLNMVDEFTIKLWGIDIRIHRTLEFDTYIVNPESPDSLLLTDQKISYQRDPELEARVFTDSIGQTRLSKADQERIIGYVKDEILSTELYQDLLESELMAGTTGLTAMKKRFGRHLDFFSSLGNFFLYNRVDGLRLHHGITLSNWPLPRLSMSFQGGYGFADKAWKGEVSTIYFLNSKRMLFVDGTLFHTLAFEESRRQHSTKKNTLTSLVYKGDYRDYFYKNGLNLGIGGRIIDPVAWRLSYVNQDEVNAVVNSKFSIFRNGKPFRLNPEILEGTFRGFRLNLIYRTHLTEAELLAEHTDIKTMGSDFEYRWIKANFGHRWKATRYEDVRFHLTGGLSWGALSPQRWFDFGGRSFLNYHGSIRGIDYKYFTGDQMASAVVAYSLKGSCFTDRNIGPEFLKLLKATVWVGGEWSDLSDRSLAMADGMDVPSLTADDGYFELGLGIGDALNIFRFDVIYSHLNEGNWVFQFSVLQ